MKKIFFVVAVICASFASDIKVLEPYARESIANQTTSAAFFTLKNESNKDISLVNVSTSVAKTAELHTHIEENAMKKMVKIDKIDIPANSSVELRPGGLHIMLIDINSPLKQGDKISLNLEFSDNTKVTLENIEVKNIKNSMKDMKH